MDFDGECSYSKSAATPHAMARGRGLMIDWFLFVAGLAVGGFFGSLFGVILVVFAQAAGDYHSNKQTKKQQMTARELNERVMLN